MAKVSVLVPIYNVEEFLPQCLDTLVNQTLKDIEIVCINDGSPDSCLEIIKDYAKKDSRIVVIDKKNSGYGSSMNKGLSVAKGEYIGIVEPDDFIDLDAFECLYKTASKNKAEVVKANYYQYCGETDEDSGVSALFNTTFPNDETGRLIDPQVNRSIFLQQPSIWAAIYKRSFLEENKIQFLPTPGASYQDLGFNFKVWASARRAFFIERAFLHYREDNQNSSVKSASKIYAVKDEYEGIKQFITDKGLFEKLKKEYYACKISSYIWNLDRLPKSAAMKFAKELKLTFKEARKEKAIGVAGAIVGKRDQNYKIAKHPKRYVLSKDFREGTKRRVFKIAKIIFPFFRYRARIIKELNELESAQKRLYSEINKLKKENEELKKGKNK